MYKEFDIGESIEGTPYRVVGLIGQGGMGSVYEVEHRELGKRFVLKALLRELVCRNDLVQRLRNEWRALGKLEHPNIVSVTDAGVTTTGVPYYVMERLYGVTLGQQLRTQGTLSVRATCNVAAEILEGLSAAHAIGVVHRDVKPPNIFLTRIGTVKILDFGIAKLLDGNASITARGYAIGTPRYMSPEQASGGAVDARADLYAVGLLIFEMLGGQSPFESAEPKDLFMAHILQRAPALSELVPTAPSELVHLVAKLLEKDPNARPRSAEAVADVLRAMGRSASAPPRADDTQDSDDTQAAPFSGALTPVVNGPTAPGMERGTPASATGYRGFAAQLGADPASQRRGSARVRVDRGASGEGPTEARPSRPAGLPASSRNLPNTVGSRTEVLAQLEARLPVTRTSAPVPLTPPPVSNSTPAWDVTTGQESPPPQRPLTGAVIAAGVIGAMAAVAGIWLLAPSPETVPAAMNGDAAEGAAALPRGEQPLTASPLKLEGDGLADPATVGAETAARGERVGDVRATAPKPVALSEDAAAAQEASTSLGQAVERQVARQPRETSPPSAASHDVSRSTPPQADEERVLEREPPAAEAPAFESEPSQPQKPEPAPRGRRLPSSGIPGF